MVERKQQACCQQNKSWTVCGTFVTRQNRGEYWQLRRKLFLCNRACFLLRFLFSWRSRRRTTHAVVTHHTGTHATHSRTHGIHVL